MSFTGRSTGAFFRYGDSLQVYVENIDLVTETVSWSLDLDKAVFV
jgi:hypothetical protein